MSFFRFRPLKICHLLIFLRIIVYLLLSKQFFRYLLNDFSERWKKNLLARKKAFALLLKISKVNRERNSLNVIFPFPAENLFTRKKSTPLSVALLFKIFKVNSRNSTNVIYPFPAAENLSLANISKICCLSVIKSVILSLTWSMISQKDGKKISLPVKRSSAGALLCMNCNHLIIETFFFRPVE